MSWFEAYYHYRFYMQAMSPTDGGPHQCRGNFGPGGRVGLIRIILDSEVGRMVRQSTTTTCWEMQTHKRPRFGRETDDESCWCHLMLCFAFRPKNFPRAAMTTMGFGTRSREVEQSRTCFFPNEIGSGIVGG